MAPHATLYEPRTIAELTPEELADWRDFRETDERAARLYIAYGDWLSVEGDAAELLEVAA